MLHYQAKGGGGEQYQTPYDRTLYNLVNAGETSTITWTGWGIEYQTPSDHTPNFPSNRRMLQYQERGSGHNSTRPRRIIPLFTSSKLEKQGPSCGREGAYSARPRRIIPLIFPSNGRMLQYQDREGGGTTVTDPVGSYPPLERPSKRLPQNIERGSGHSSTRPRRSIPSKTS